MHIKNFTLSSLPYLVGVASLVVAAHEAAPAFRFENTRTESTHISDQIYIPSIIHYLLGWLNKPFLYFQITPKLPPESSLPYFLPPPQ